MKNTKTFLVRMLPMLLILVMTVILSLFLYQSTIERETEECWEQLRTETENYAAEVSLRFSDNTTFLDLVADAIAYENLRADETSLLSYLATVQGHTIFTGMNILYPDNTILLQDGEHVSFDGLIPFEELVKKGSHVSPRRYNQRMGTEVVYYFTPVEFGDETICILIGMVDCEELTKIFPVHIYEGRLAAFLVDRDTGDFLIDNWHKDKNGNAVFGNIKNLGTRERLPGYEEKDFLSEILGGKEGSVALISQVIDAPCFMYYTPVENELFNWEMCLMVPENVAFSDVHSVQKNLFLIAVVEVVFLLLYFLWNLFITARSVKTEAQVREMEMTRAASEAKSTFLATISHDIRTPLNGIIGMIDIIEKNEHNSERVRECLKKIDVSSQYLLTLANNVLELNEIESGKIRLQKDHVELPSLLEDITTLIQPKLPEAKVSYRLTVAPLEHPFVTCSKLYLERILINLIGNAVKYNKVGGSVELSVKELSFDGLVGIYQFTVSDTGIGISDDFKAHMFESFEQENSGARTRFSGHGLGLSIVKKLVESMQGRIDVESQKNVGSVFTVTLPFIVDAASSCNTIELPDTSSPSDLTGLRILLVEDNELNLEIAQFLLSDAGAEITSAINGQKALELFTGCPCGSFDLILMDLMMPEMDGYEALAAIRSLSDRPDASSIPIFAMTAANFAEDIQKCKDAGFTDHVAKPLDMPTLLAVVAKHVHRPNNQ